MMGLFGRKKPQVCKHVIFRPEDIQVEVGMFIVEIKAEGFCHHCRAYVKTKDLVANEHLAVWIKGKLEDSP